MVAHFMERGIRSLANADEINALAVHAPVVRGIVSSSEILGKSSHLRYLVVPVRDCNWALVGSPGS
jgi:hypothetical protein